MDRHQQPCDKGRYERVRHFEGLVEWDEVALSPGWRMYVSPGGYYTNFERRWYVEIWKTDPTNFQSFRFNGRHVFVNRTICASDVAIIRQLAIFAMQVTEMPLECGDIQTWYCLKAARII